MRTLYDMEYEAKFWQDNARLAHQFATSEPHKRDRKYWQLKARKYATLAIHALDACNIMKGMDHVD